MAARGAQRTRTTRETDIRLALELDGNGTAEITTGVGFFDHMLTLFARHGLFDLRLSATGDLEVDAHHTVEDTGLLLGATIAEALGDKAGVVRYGWASIPMDEACVTAIVDLSGRAHLRYDLTPGAEMVGTFPTALAQEFFQALVNEAGLTLHLCMDAPGNAHHVLEAAFKAFARALRTAVRIDPAEPGIPSSKGTL